jgi:hypothetical protein
LRREWLRLGFWIAGDAASTCRHGVITPWTAGQLLHDDLGLSRDAFIFYHSSLRVHAEQALGMLVQRFGILWRKLNFSLPTSTLVLSACFHLHNFCVDSGESTISAALLNDECRVVDAAFRTWFCAAQKAREDRATRSEQGQRRDLDTSSLREYMTLALRDMGMMRPRWMGYKSPFEIKK